MSELIDKQKVLEKLWELDNFVDFEGMAITRKAIKLIENIPVVEIIHCKDCKYSHMTIDGFCKYCDLWFPNEEMYESGEHFCAKAKRKSNDS